KIPRPPTRLLGCGKTRLKPILLRARPSAAGTHSDQQKLDSHDFCFCQDDSRTADRALSDAILLASSRRSRAGLAPGPAVGRVDGARIASPAHPAAFASARI